MLKANKRAIMGIGTLIIFIATILVAAVAAGVLISTSGVLQQRALITGQEARKKITNSIEIISIIARGNKTDESLNDFEILVRLDAGSDPIQMKKFDMSWIGPDSDAAASLQHPSLNNPNAVGYTVDQVGFDDAVGEVTNTSWTYIRDLDDDNVMEKVKVVVGKNASNSTTGIADFLLFNFSSDDAGYYLYNLSQDISNVSQNVTLDISDQPIIGQDGLYYGYFDINGNISVANTISSNMTFNITANPFGPCSFDTLAPETKYCYVVMHGNDDLVLGDGEVFKLRFKLRPQNQMYIGQEFRFIFESEKGRLSQAQARTPDVITTLKVPLWPVG